MSLNIDQNDVIKKKARGLKDDNLGKVQEAHGDTIITKIGVVDKETMLSQKAVLQDMMGIICGLI